MLGQESETTFGDKVLQLHRCGQKPEVPHMANDGTCGCSGLKSGMSACELPASRKRPCCNPHSSAEQPGRPIMLWQPANVMSASVMLSASTSAMPA